MFFRKIAVITKSGSVERIYRCQSCGLRTDAYVRCKATEMAEGGWLSDAPDVGERAADAMREQSVDLLNLVRCPRCGERNKPAVTAMKLGVGVATVVTAGCGLLVWPLMNTALVALPIVFGLLAGRHVLRSLWRFKTAQSRVTFDDSIVRADAPIGLPPARARAKLAPPRRELPEPQPKLPEPPAIETDDEPSQPGVTLGPSLSGKPKFLD